MSYPSDSKETVHHFKNSGNVKTRVRRETISIPDLLPQDRIQSYLYEGHFRRDERIFTMAGQTVNRRIHQLVERVGREPINITCHTSRHSFAIHLLLKERPLKIVSQLLGHTSIESTGIYTNVLTADGGHFLDRLDFH